MELALPDDRIPGDLVLHDGDARNVGQGLGQSDVGVGERHWFTAEKVETPEASVLQPHRDRAHRRKPGPDALGGEPRPR